jgi:ABC-type transporter lipoprotein component MlaA
MKNYDTLKGAAIDPYVALRDAFSARRAQQFREHTAGRSQPNAPGKSTTP